MTQNLTASISAPIRELLKLLAMRPLAWSVPVLMGAMALNGQQINNVQVGTTATQAVITYLAPDSAVCAVEIHEGALNGPLVPDVDPSLFPSSNLDSRAVNLVTGRRRVFVAGKRAAESALDGLRHSRALQTNTSHSYKITCGSTSATGTFLTVNAPLGASYNDPLPADPLQPGQYAWPDFSWTDRNQWVVDPFTGFRTRLFDSPRDATEGLGSGRFVSASNLGGSDWTNPSAVLNDDAAAATYSGTTQGWMFVELGIRFGNSAVHNPAVNSTNAFVPNFNAWCSSGDCAGASFDDRSIQFCITIDGTSCASDMLEAALSPCTANCTGADFRFPAIGNPTPMLAEWYAQTRSGVPNIETADFTYRTGVVSRNGAAVTLLGGDRFNIHWNAGSLIKLNGTAYTIASVDSDGGITLSGTPDGSDAQVFYVGSNSGILIRKKTAGTQQISIQALSYSYETGQAPTAESGGDENTFSNCSPAEVTGPNAEKGWHCTLSGEMYWVGKESGTVNRIGHTIPYYNTAPDGWLPHTCPGGSFWDSVDANVLYCPTTSLQGHTVVLKFVYTGGNTDIGDQTYFQPLVLCTQGPAPCWTITNMTPGNSAVDLQMARFHPDWAASKFRTNQISLFGQMGSTNSLTFMARRDIYNDTLAFIFRFDLNTGQIVGGVPTWRYFPMRWASMHGPTNLNDPQWMNISATFMRGPAAGRDYAAGNGPYLNTMSNALSGSNEACPARPAGSPIAASDWPTGNLCVTVTVDGEPGDPTPLLYNDGTITVSGTNVTGSNTNWNGFMNGVQMLIGNAYYVFTFVDNTHGTLDRAPGDSSGTPYTLYLEPVNNPKLGNPSFGYLQDAEVRDFFCATPVNTTCNFDYSITEFMRLIVKNGKTWILQRGYAGTLPQKPLHALPAGSWLIATPSSCYIGDVYFCAESRALWNAVADPYGYNASGTTVVKDANEKGCCHATRQNEVNVAAGLTCPNRGEGADTGCYFARFSGPPSTFSDEGYAVGSNPTFHNLPGIGVPNAVDSHPSHNQVAPAAAPNELRWVADARVYLGATVTGSASSPGSLVGGTLYRFTPAQLPRLNPRVLPTMASCGVNPLLDVSAPAPSLISTGPSDNYKYCIVMKAGECARESAPGELYVNCPQVRTPYCSFAAVGTSDPETRNICVADMGASTLNLTQVGIDKPDPDGVNTRRATAAYGRYQWINQFWNSKILPNGRWMMAWSMIFQGQRNSVLLVKLPPFPDKDGINRGDFLPYRISIPASKLSNVTNAVVRFGYDRNFYCTSRREGCVQAAAADFKYDSELPAGVPCTNGCVVSVQALPQRVLYYQVQLRDASNNVVSTMDSEAVAMK